MVFDSLIDKKENTPLSFLRKFLRGYSLSQCLPLIMFPQYSYEQFGR